MIKDNPLYAPAHNNLAQLLLQQGELDVALLHAQTEVALGGEFLQNYLYTLQAINARM